MPRHEPIRAWHPLGQKRKADWPCPHEHPYEQVSKLMEHRRWKAQHRVHVGPSNKRAHQDVHGAHHDQAGDQGQQFDEVFLHFGLARCCCVYRNAVDAFARRGVFIRRMKTWQFRTPRLCSPSNEAVGVVKKRGNRSKRAMRGRWRVGQGDALAHRQSSRMARSGGSVFARVSPVMSQISGKCSIAPSMDSSNSVSGM